MGRGTEAEYKELLRLLEPIRAAGITVHVTIGNHDNRENLWKLIPFLKKEQMGIQAGVIELPLMLTSSCWIPEEREFWEKNS